MKQDELHMARLNRMYDTDALPSEIQAAPEHLALRKRLVGVMDKLAKKYNVKGQAAMIWFAQKIQELAFGHSVPGSPLDTYSEFDED